MREVARVPETRVSDWMHTLVASGGIAQCLVNGFCLALAAGPSAFTLADLDTFAATVVLPRAQTRLQKGFFSNRVVRRWTPDLDKATPLRNYSTSYFWRNVYE